MRMNYVSLEEAHPPIRRVSEMQMATALLRAVEGAMRKGAVQIPVPDSLRPHILARKQRHSFGETR